MNDYVDESCDLFEPFYTLKDYLKSQIDMAQGLKYKTISPEFLSKNLEYSSRPLCQDTQSDHSDKSPRIQ